MNVSGTAPLGSASHATRPSSLTSHARPATRRASAARRSAPLVEGRGDQGGIGAGGDQLGGDPEGLRRHVRVAERARVGVDRGEEVRRDAGGERQAETPPGAGRPSRPWRPPPVSIQFTWPYTAVVGVVVDVDDRRGRRPAPDRSGLRSDRGSDSRSAPPRRAAPSTAGQDAIALDPGQEAERARRRVRAAVRHRPAARPQRRAERQQRAEHVGVGMDVAEHERPCRARAAKRRQAPSGGTVAPSLLVLHA